MSSPKTTIFRIAGGCVNLELREAAVRTLIVDAGHRSFVDPLAAFKQGFMFLERETHSSRLKFVEEHFGKPYGSGLSITPCGYNNRDELLAAAESYMLALKTHGIQADLLLYEDDKVFDVFVFVPFDQDQARIDALVAQLDEGQTRLHTEAIAAGFKDEICPKCGNILLAHFSMLRCLDEGSCPMTSREADGSAVKVFQTTT